MKYISTVLFALCLGWTWKIIHTEPKVAFQVHSTLQSKLADIIEKSIIELKPDSDNFKILNIWTENVSPSQIKAHFTYRFDEVDSTGELVETIIDGSALISKEESIASDNEHWIISSVKTNTGSLNFREGIVINPFAKETPVINKPEVEATTPPPATIEAATESENEKPKEENQH